jgi:dihydroneopterin aldolase
MTDVILLDDLRLEAIVGVLEHERVTPQSISVSLEIERPFGLAALDDNLNETTNYADILTLVEKVIREGKFLLLETLVVQVGEAVLATDVAIRAVTVTAKKLVPPVPQSIATVGVRTTVRRS